MKTALSEIAEGNTVYEATLENPTVKAFKSQGKDSPSHGKGENGSVAKQSLNRTGSNLAPQQAHTHP